MIFFYDKFFILRKRVRIFPKTGNSEITERYKSSICIFRRTPYKRGYSCEPRRIENPFECDEISETGFLVARVFEKTGLLVTPPSRRNHVKEREIADEGRGRRRNKV